MGRHAHPHTHTLRNVLLVLSLAAVAVLALRMGMHMSSGIHASHLPMQLHISPTTHPRMHSFVPRLTHSHTRLTHPVYTVRAGDCLWSIARSSHSHSSWQHLARLNHIRAPYTIRPGQKLSL